MSFKFPTIKRKDQRVSCLAKDLPSLCWNDLVDKDEIGRGTFGSVFAARNTTNGAGDTAFVKKAGPASECSTIQGNLLRSNSHHVGIFWVNYRSKVLVFRTPVLKAYM